MGEVGGTKPQTPNATQPSFGIYTSWRAVSRDYGIFTRNDGEKRPVEGYSFTETTNLLSLSG